MLGRKSETLSRGDVIGVIESSDAVIGKKFET
jgi:hypothetical protein